MHVRTLRAITGQWPINCLVVSISLRRVTRSEWRGIAGEDKKEILPRFLPLILWRQTLLQTPEQYLGSEEHLGETPEGPSHTRCEAQPKPVEKKKKRPLKTWRITPCGFLKKKRKKGKDILRIYTTFWKREKKSEEAIDFLYKLLQKKTSAEKLKLNIVLICRLFRLNGKDDLWMNLTGSRRWSRLKVRSRTQNPIFACLSIASSQWVSDTLLPCYWLPVNCWLFCPVTVTLVFIVVDVLFF